MSGPDVLGDAPGPGGGQRGRPGRRALVGGAVLLVAVAALLAARSTPDRPQRPVAVPTTLPPYTPAPGLVPETGPASVVLDAVPAGDLIYALVASCGSGGTLPCGLALHALAGGRWTETPLRLPFARDGTDMAWRLVVTGPDERYLVVFDAAHSRAHVSADAGRTFTERAVRAGAPVAAVPAGLVPDIAGGRLVVLDPVSGQLRPLATQPPVGTVRAVGDDALVPDDGVLRAAGQVDGVLVVASSSDGGRRWTRAELGRVPYELPRITLVSPPGGPPAAYLLASARRGTDGNLALGEVWRTDGGSAGWTRIARPAARLPNYVDAVGMSDGGILVTDAASSGWRVFQDGTLRQLPDQPESGPARLPIRLRRGGTGLLVATATDGRHLLTRERLATGWTPVRLPD